MQQSHDIELLEEFGLQLGFPYVSHLDDEIWELRIRGRDVHRILYFAARGHEFVLVHAFTKKSQKTPRREIQIAKDRARLYLQLTEELSNEDPPTDRR